MNTLETRMTRWYWRQVGGTLVEEFPIVPRSSGGSQQVVDGIIIRRGKWRLAHWTDVSLEGQDLILVHARAERLNLALMGQALFSARLVERFRPRSLYSVALVSHDDSVLRPLLEEDRNMKVVICPDLRNEDVKVGVPLLDEEAGES
jgi:hypothetical protein